jgi:hypothetical protein
LSLEDKVRELKQDSIDKNLHKKAVSIAGSSWWRKKVFDDGCIKIVRQSRFVDSEHNVKIYWLGVLVFYCLDFDAFNPTYNKVKVYRPDVKTWIEWLDYLYDKRIELPRIENEKNMIAENFGIKEDGGE